MVLAGGPMKAPLTGIICALDKTVSGRLSLTAEQLIATHIFPLFPTLQFRSYLPTLIALTTDLGGGAGLMQGVALYGARKNVENQESDLDRGRQCWEMSESSSGVQAICRS